MVTATCPNRETLLQYSSGKLPDERSDELARHLESCPHCQATIVTLEDVDDTLIGRLRTPLGGEPFLAEPEFQAAVDQAIAMPGAKPMDDRAGGDATSTPPILQMLGEYRILEELGRGGMGRVYKALHTKLDRVVGIKVLRGGRMEDGQTIARFGREMKAIGQLDHPNLVRAYDAREIDGTPVLIMEFVDGLDLAEIVRRLGSLPVSAACEIIRQTALGLQRAHEHGLVHRDVKPSNIMLTVGQAASLPAPGQEPQRKPERARIVGQAGSLPYDAAVKLLDLGLARFYAESPSGEEMTGTGQAMGTADYMAPEQASDSRTVDIRADIYSLGCTLYKLLSGRAPFSGPEYRGNLDKMNAHVSQPAPPIRELVPEVPEELASILDRMLAKAPGDRFATPSEVAEALEPFCTGANLADLAARASTEGPLILQEKAGAKEEQVEVPGRAAAPIRRRSAIKTVLLGLAFLGTFAAGFAAGVVITIKKNGQTYQLDVPPDSQTTVDENGNATVSIPSEKGGTARPRLSVIEPDALEKRDAHELVSVSFPLDKGLPKEALAEVRRLLGPRGAFTLKFRELVVIDEAGRVRQIRDLLKQVAADLAALQGPWKVVRVEKGKAAESSWNIRDTRIDVNSIESFSFQESERVGFCIHYGGRGASTAIRYSIDATATPKTIDLREQAQAGSTEPDFIALGVYQLEGERLKICFTKQLPWKPQSRPKALAIDPNSRDVLFLLERPADAEKEQGDTPRLVVYQVVGISPDLALRILQEVLAPDVRLVVDAKTGNLIVFARPAQHAVVRDVLERIRSGPKADAGNEQGDTPRLEAYRLGGISPDVVLEVLRPLLAGAPGVRLDADPKTGNLIVLGRPAQHAVVRDALERLRSSPKSGPAKPPAAAKPAVKIRFNFRHQPWKDVLDWLAEAAGLSLVGSAPTGTFNYTDSRGYTPAEAIDLVNSVLLTKGYTLVRRDRMLTVIHLDDVRQTEAIPIVPLEILDTRGEFEFVSVLFNLEKVKPEEAAEAVRPLLGPHGWIAPLPATQQLSVTETAGRVRQIRDVLKRLEASRGVDARLSSPGPVGAALPDEKAIQGTWEIVSSTFGLVRKLPNGKDGAPDEVLKTTKVVIADDTLKITGKHVTAFAFEYRLNPAAKTKIIDLQTPGTDYGLVSYGIYQLDRDQLKICTSPLRCLEVHNDRPDAKVLRPSELWAELGSGKELLVLRRVGDAVIADDEKAIQGTWRVENVQGAAPGLLFGFSQRVVFSARGIAVHGTTAANMGVMEDFDLRLGYALDPTVQPKRIDIATVASPPIEPLHGIYELQGNQLTIAWAVCKKGGVSGFPAGRPPSKPAFGPDTTVVVFKRVNEVSNKERGGVPPRPSGSPTVTTTSKPDAGNADQARAIAEIEKLRGTTIKSARLAGWFVTDAAMEHLERLTQLESLSLGHAQITDAGMKHVKGLTNLQSLDLTFTKVTDAGVEHIKGLTKLRALDLHGVGMTDAGLEHLKALANLQELSLYNTAITDAGLERLQGFTKLKSLDLGANRITGAGLKHLKGLTQLQSLNLIWTGTTDAGLEHLKPLTQLQSLNLYATQVTDAGLEHLKGLLNLQSLVLWRTKVTDAGLKHLKGLAKLESLVLRETRVTDAGIRDLRQALPACRIEAGRTAGNSP